MITKEILKKEIDNVQYEYIDVLYRIIKSFEYPSDMIYPEVSENDGVNEKKEWLKFIDKFSGSLADTPIQRGSQGEYEVREGLAV